MKITKFILPFLCASHVFASTDNEDNNSSIPSMMSSPASTIHNNSPINESENELFHRYFNDSEILKLYVPDGSIKYHDIVLDSFIKSYDNYGLPLIIKTLREMILRGNYNKILYECERQAITNNLLFDAVFGYYTDKNGIKHTLYNIYNIKNNIQFGYSEQFMFYFTINGQITCITQ